jgi:hypothetical protein
VGLQSASYHPPGQGESGGSQRDNSAGGLLGDVVGGLLKN